MERRFNLALLLLLGIAMLAGIAIWARNGFPM